MHIGHGEHHHDHDAEEIQGFASLDQALAVMQYMLDHNRHHAEELHNLTHRLEAMEKDNAAALLDMALDAFHQGNQRLEAAIEALKKEG